jgi:ferredoxin-NADP reductase
MLILCHLQFRRQCYTATQRLYTQVAMNISLTVLQRRIEADGCQSVVFERPRNFHYAGGQWLDLYFATDGPETAKTFSFASSPTEPDLVISFREGLSALKRQLQAVEPGDKVLIASYGGGFRLNPRREAVLLAGGIGMAVFRSMIKEAMDTQVNTRLRLVYLNGSTNFLYRDELDAWRQTFPALKIHYLATKTDGRLTIERLAQIVPGLQDSDVFIAGPPAMVTRTQELVLNAGIQADHIQTDSFDGY